MTPTWRNSLVLLGILLSLNLSFGLKCFNCRIKDGVGDIGCDEDPPPEKYLVECAQPQCWMKYSNNGTKHFERFCVAMASNMNGCIAAMAIDDKGYSHSGLECKCSDADGCNGKVPESGSDTPAASES